MSQIILIGIIISLIYTELTGLSPGGLIVPAYFALYINDPIRCLATVAIAFLCMLTVRALQEVTVLYGRRRYAVYVVSGIFYKALFNFVLFPNPAFFFSLSASIGYLIPGILGRDMERQGIPKTLISLGIVVLLIRVAQLAVGLG